MKQKRFPLFLLSIIACSHISLFSTPVPKNILGSLEEPQTIFQGLIQRELTGKNIPRNILEQFLYSRSKQQESISLGQLGFSLKYSFSKDNKFFACIHGRGHKKILLIDIQTKIHRSISLIDSIETLLISNDSTTMFIATRDGYIYTYSLRENRIKYKTKAYQESHIIINIMLALSSDDKKLFICYQNEQPIIISYSVNDCTLTTPKHINFMNESEYLEKFLLCEHTNEVVIIQNNKMRLFNINTTQTQEKEIKGIQDILLLPDNKAFLIATNNFQEETSCIYSYNQQTTDLSEWSSCIPGYINELALSPSGELLIAKCFSHGQPKILFLNMKSKRIALTVPTNNNVLYLTPQQNKPGHFFAIRSNLPERYLELWSPF